MSDTSSNEDETDDEEDEVDNDTETENDETENEEDASENEQNDDDDDNNDNNDEDDENDDNDIDDDDDTDDGIKKKKPTFRGQKSGKTKSVESDENDSSDLVIKKKKKSLKRKRASDDKIISKVRLHEGWEANTQITTKDIDFSQWQMSHPARETFFIGPDNYIYPNASAMKKFVEAIKKKEVKEKAVSIPIPPMYKVISTNPRFTIGVTGSRYISPNGEGYRVQPIFFLGKEYVS